MSLKAIETRYAGYRFRSRTEARWAVFFDSLGVKWEYEPEGWNLPDGTRYLPDFFIEMRNGPTSRFGRCGYWVEIKAGAPTDGEMEKLVQLCTETKHHGLFLCGQPGNQKLISVENDGRIRHPRQYLEFSQIAFCCEHFGDSNKFDAAVKAARSKRFEFGEADVA